LEPEPFVISARDNEPAMLINANRSDSPVHIKNKIISEIHPIFSNSIDSNQSPGYIIYSDEDIDEDNLSIPITSNNKRLSPPEKKKLFK
jgi:hypothetical protein